MNKLKYYLDEQPVALFGSLQAVLVALTGVFVAFGLWTPTQEQITALAGFWAVLTGFLTRFVWGKVTPVVKVDGAVQARRYDLPPKKVG